MESSPGWITSWAINLALVNSKKEWNHSNHLFWPQCSKIISQLKEKKTIKNSNIGRLNNTLLNNQQIIEEIKKEIKICIETNENVNTVTQNLWDTVKRVLRGRFKAIQAYLKKQEKSQINSLTLHLKQLEKEEMKNPRISRRKEILNIIAEINARETKETVAKINKAKSWFFEKINKKIDKLSQTHQKTKGEKSNQPNWKWKWRDHNIQHRNTKDHKRLLSASIRK